LSVDPPFQGCRILLAAGGTGGHLFPAVALANVLGARGHEPHIVTDSRGGRFDKAVGDIPLHHVVADTVRSRSPLSLARTALTLARGTAQAYRLIGRLKPAAAIGFGGYPTLPPLYAASLRGVPIALHEANAVLGRANRALSGKASAIAVSFAETQGLAESDKAKVQVTGNPVRQMVIEASGQPYRPPGPGQPFRVLVFGGSQGAQIFADVVPGAIARLDAGLRGRIELVQQARSENLEHLREAYRRLGVRAEVADFFDDLPRRIAEAHLVISRSGAGTVAELAVIGRAALMVPLPHSLDNDQLMNASALARAGGGWVLPQAGLDAPRLAEEIAKRINDPDGLARAASAAAGVGRADAAERLADLVETIAGTSSGRGDTQ
jgi:UDP-N-acetylglucosamine--N-acetylmuramyl-(pentapeptide) pyrophosphoryl-undecaprenol N-acetylglucosamine transferase